MGEPAVFAIESTVTETFKRLSLRALGFFLIHVGGLKYGVSEPDATMLAGSFDEVGRRISERGLHTCAFSTELDPAKLADAVSLAIYSDAPDDEYFFGIPRSGFSELITSRDLLWAPDGDEAFDDGSHILQFDIEDRVRLIAFKRTGSYGHDSGTLRDVWLAENDFYGILRQWRHAFESDWATKSGLGAGGSSGDDRDY